MPGTPKPVGSSGNLDTLHNAIAQGMLHQRTLTAALAAVSAAQGSLLVKSAQNTGSFTPSLANDFELPGAGPSVTAQVGTSGLVLLTASATIQVTTTLAAGQLGEIAYAYTPQGGSQTGPSSGPSSTIVAVFGSPSAASISPAPTSASFQTKGTASGGIVLAKLPAGLVTFVLYCQSSLSQGAIFTGLELVIQPL